MIELSHVNKIYPNGNQALRDINLRINDGEFVFIVGSSGAGKSTLTKIIMTEEQATSGRVMVNGSNLMNIKRKKIPYLRRSIGVVFQDFRLIPTMNVYDNVAFALRVTNVPRKDIRRRVPYILNLVGLNHKAKAMPAEISGGEQQRVALARALVNNPSLIIADEPTGNIDPTMTYEIMELLIEINAVGTTILMVTHEHDLVTHFEKRVIVIEDGRMVSDKPDPHQRPLEETEILLSEPRSRSSNIGNRKRNKQSKNNRRKS